jgi:hypothetical protein
MHGDGIKSRMDVPGSLVCPSATRFFTEDIRKIFEIEVKKLDENELTWNTATVPWSRPGNRSRRRRHARVKLCDIAMSGDRGIDSRFEDFEFKLGRTIAEGHPVCEVQFLRKK